MVVYKWRHASLAFYAFYNKGLNNCQTIVNPLYPNVTSFTDNL